MAKIVTVKVDGLQELDRRLREFGPKVAKNGLRSATYAGAKVFLNAVRAELSDKGKHPWATGFGASQLVTKRRRTPGNVAKYSVVARNVTHRYGNTRLNRRLKRVGRKYKADGPGFYLKFVEFGRGPSNSGKSPFMRPAFINNVDAAKDAVKDGLQRAVVRATKKR